MSGPEKILILLATFGSVAVGVAIPANVLIYGRSINKFVNYTSNSTTDIHAQIVRELVPYSILVASTCLFFGFLEMFLWELISAKQKRKLRMATFDKLMRLHQGWFDNHTTGELTSKIFS